MLLAALPAAAQMGPLISQNLFLNRAAGARAGNYLEADGGLVFTDNVGRNLHGTSDTLDAKGR